jgi:hypothetical protein
MPVAALAPIADAGLALTAAAQQTEVHIDMPEKVVVASAEVQPLRAKMKTVQKRQDAKAKRMAAKRKQHYARRHGARRSTVASRRQARAARYAFSEKASSRRVARSRAVSRDGRYAHRQARDRRPVTSRAVKRTWRRVAETQILGTNAWRPLNGSRLLRGVPTGALRDERMPTPKMPAAGPVQVV